MRDDADFSAYAVARWPALVRALSLLGSPTHEAHALGRVVLARLRSDWRHRDELGDLDEHTAWTLQDCRARAGLQPEERTLVVLQALLDVGGPAPEAELAAVRVEAETLVVEPIDLDQVARLDQQQRRERRRRTTRIVLVVVTVLAVVAGVWTWWATRPSPPPGLPDATVERTDNPVSVGWYADRRLQLDRVRLGIDDLRSFAEVPQGAVYSDTAGEVILVETDGTRTRLGTQAPDGRFAASEQDGLVAWVDVDDRPELRVYDLAEREVAGSIPVEAPAEVLAIDDGIVYLNLVDGSYLFEHDSGWSALARIGSGLLDVAGDARAFQYGPQALLVTHGDSRVGVARSGTGAQLAPEGDYVLTQTGGAEGRVRIYETIEGEEIDTGLDRSTDVYAATLGGHGRATYLVGLEQGEPDDGPRLSSSGSLQLVTCPLVDPDQFTSCTVHRTFPRSSSWALPQ